MDAGFWHGVLSLRLGLLLGALALAAVGWFVIRHLLQRRPETPLEARPLRLLVVLARPLLACPPPEADPLPALAVEEPPDDIHCLPIAAPSAALSHEVLERTFIETHAPLEVRYLRVPTAAGLQQALLEGYDALLFDGPALVNGTLALESSSGEQHPVTVEQLGQYLREGRVRLVCLGACYSSTIGRDLRRADVGAVAGMATPGRADLVATFVGGFFGALAHGQNVHQSLGASRRAITAQFAAPAERKAWPQLSARRWPALRLVQPGARGEYLGESTSLPLPAPPAVDWVGRGKDIILVNRLLSQYRLVTLTGADGIGKTVLARAVARWHWERGFASAGVRLIPLDHLAQGQDLAEALLQHLGTTYRPLEGLDEAGLFRHRAEWLFQFLGQGEWLLVLDNLGPLLDERALWLLQTLLKRCAGLRLLVTSRECVGLTDEQSYPLPPLTKESAQELFCRWAKYPLAGADGEEVSALCETLDYHPLAIELVARQADPAPAKVSLALKERAGRTQSAAEDPSLPDPEQDPAQAHGLALALGYSYRHLSREAQSFLCAFAVFRGGAAEDALAKVMGFLPDWEQSARELQERGLLEHGLLDGSWRYWLPPGVAEYAAARFRQDTAGLELERPALQRSHALHYRGVARQIAASLASGGHAGDAGGPKEEGAAANGQRGAEQSALSIFALEKPNLLAAVEGAYEIGDWNLAWRLSQDVGDVLRARCLWSDEARIYTLGAVAARRAYVPHVEGQMLRNLGRVYRLQGRWNEAALSHRKDLAIGREQGDRNAVAQALEDLGRACADQGHWAEASALYRQSLQHFHELADRRGEARVLANLGEAFHQQHLWVEAARAYQESGRRFRELEDRRAEGETLAALAGTYADQGRWGEAAALDRESLAIFRQLQSDFATGRVLSHLGNAHHAQQQWTEAVACYEEYCVICRTLGDRRGEGVALAHLGELYAVQDRWREAIATEHESVRLFRELEDRHGECQALGCLGLLYAHQGRWSEASSASQESLRLARELAVGYDEARALNNLGDVHLLQKQCEEAIPLYQESRRVFREGEHRHDEARVLNGVGMAYAGLGRWDEAMAAYQESVDLSRELGDRRGETQALENLGPICMQEGHWDEARACYERYLAVCRELAEPSRVGQALANLGSVHAHQERWAKANACYEEYLTLCCEQGDRLGEGQALTDLGLVCAGQDHWVQAIQQYLEGLQIFRELGSRHDEGKVLAHLSLAYASQGRWAEAIATLEQSLAIFRQLGDRHNEGEMLVGLGLVHADQAQWVEAIAAYQEGLQVFRRLGDRRSEGKVLEKLGRIHGLQGRWAEARSCYNQYLTICRDLGDCSGEEEMLANLGSLYAREGRWAEAIDCYEQCLACCRGRGYRHGEGRALAHLAMVYVDQGSWDQAIATCQKSLRAFREVRSRYDEAKVLTNLGLIYVRLELPGMAFAYWHQALAIYGVLGVPEAEQLQGWMKKLLTEE